MNTTILAGKRVLVMEDEMLIALDIEDTLRASGYEVVGPFADVANATAAAEHVRLDAGVLDVNIRGASSFGIARRLEQRGIPFLFLTGYSSDPLAAEHAHWEMFEKPYGLERLLARLREILA